MSPRALFAVVASLLLSGPASAGLVVELECREPAASPPATTFTVITLDGDRVRVDSGIVPGAPPKDSTTLEAPAEAAESSLVVRPTGEPSVQQGYPCVRVEVLDGERVVREHFVAAWAQLDVTAEALAPLARVAADPSRERRGAWSWAAELARLDGIPVLTRELADGRVQRETALLSVTRTP